MMDLVIHPTTRSALAEVTSKPPHALLLTGPEGAGKRSVALELASQILGVARTKLENSSMFMDASPEEGQPFGIDRIRGAKHFMTLRSTNKVRTDTGISRVVFMPQAHTMTKEAQNSLLKLLEEPPEDGMLLLTATSEHALLPTIISRCQAIAVKKPDTAELTRVLVSRGNASADVDLALRISDGLPGLAMAMLDASGEHPLSLATSTARQLVQQTTFERLCNVESLSKQRQQCQDVCYILQQMAHLALMNTSGGSADRWQRILTSAYECQGALEQRVNTKLAMTRLMVSL